MSQPETTAASGANEAIAKAIEVIGEQERTDYLLDLAAHTRSYDKTAPELVTQVKRSEVKVTAEEYTRLDDMALKAQRNYKRTAGVANWAIFLAAVTSASLPVLKSFPNALLAVGVIAVIAGALAGALLHKLNSGHMLKRWMGLRAEAETQRLRYFNQMARPTSPFCRSAALLQLEYFRRYQLDVQRIYYRTRGGQHSDKANGTLHIGSVGVFFGAVSSAVASGAGFVKPETYLTSLALLGVAGAALASLANSRESISQDQRNSERYERTAQALNGLYGRLDEVREGVAGGDAQLLQEFVEAVHEQLSLEHRQWLENMQEEGGATGRLAERLEALKPKSDPEGFDTSRRPNDCGSIG